MPSPWDEVGDGCFRRRYASFDLNIGVVRGSDGLLIFDTRCHAGEAEELLDELRALGRGPVRRIVNSHWHFDHWWGNGRFLQQARTPMPGFAAVAPDLELWAHARFVEGLGQETEAAKAFLSTSRPEWAPFLDMLQPAVPDHLVEGEHVIDLGDREVSLRHPGRGHTDNDLVIVVPDADVVYAGDVVEESASPSYGDDSFPLDWPASNTRLLEWVSPTATVVPGHGDTMTRASIVEQTAAIRTVAQTIRGLHAAGIPETDALDSAEWPFATATLTSAVHRAYRELHHS